jgi:mannose-6-phosphate isomerase-like protein (cupin superfamily)
MGHAAPISLAAGCFRLGPRRPGLETGLLRGRRHVSRPMRRWSTLVPCFAGFDDKVRTCVGFHRRTWRLGVCRHTCALGAAVVVIAVAGCGHDTPTPAEASGKQTYLFRSADAKPWTRSPAIGGLTLTTGENNSDVSASIVNLTGPHGRIRNSVNTRLYFVLRGPVKFEVDGQEFVAQNDDVILVPRGSPYDYSAENARLLLVDVPALDLSADAPA